MTKTIKTGKAVEKKESVVSNWGKSVREKKGEKRLLRPKRTEKKEATLKPIKYHT